MSNYLNVSTANIPLTNKYLDTELGHDEGVEHDLTSTIPIFNRPSTQMDLRHENYSPGHKPAFEMKMLALRHRL